VYPSLLIDLAVRFDAAVVRSWSIPIGLEDAPVPAIGEQHSLSPLVGLACVCRPPFFRSHSQLL